MNLEVVPVCIAIWGWVGLYFLSMNKIEDSRSDSSRILYGLYVVFLWPIWFVIRRINQRKTNDFDRGYKTAK